VSARLLFANAINKLGGFTVATACFSVEFFGLMLLWLTHTEPLAFAGAALTGFGFSLVFPALGVEAVRHIPPQDKGTALGAYGSSWISHHDHRTGCGRDHWRLRLSAHLPVRRMLGSGCFGFDPLAARREQKAA